MRRRSQRTADARGGAIASDGVAEAVIPSPAPSLRIEGAPPPKPLIPSFRMRERSVFRAIPRMAAVCVMLPPVCSSTAWR